MGAARETCDGSGIYPGLFDPKKPGEPVRCAGCRRCKPPAGACDACWGKGKFTVFAGIIGYEDFGRDGFEVPPTIQTHDCKKCNGSGKAPAQQVKVSAEVTIVKGERFVVDFSTGKKIDLTHAEWMAMRFVQNQLIHTEPTL